LKTIPDSSSFQDMYSSLESLLGYTFSEKKYLIMALTHSTYSYEHKKQDVIDNERLEFLGDGILDFVIADTLFHRKMNRDEGFLSKTRALIVCEATLCAKAIDLGLGAYILLGKGEEATGGRDKPSNLANTMEAIFAAVYIDGGFSCAKDLILRIMNDAIDTALTGDLVFDYKSKILELAQTKGTGQTIRFEILDESGPVHDKSFTAAVILDDERIGQGEGHSKKLAEQEAAKVAYQVWMNRFS
jgi:ribonuclease-3